MKKLINIMYIGGAAVILLLAHQSCTTPQAITDKTGAQLWGENCGRCHNAPSPADYSDNQWDAITMHMKVKAGLTNAEVEKITSFLKSAN